MPAFADRAPALESRRLKGRCTSRPRSSALSARDGGVALYLLALSAFKRRNVRSFNTPRLVAATALTLLVAAATALPALLPLALVAATTCALITYEVFRYADVRDRIRHGNG